MESPVTPPDLMVCLDEDEAYAGTSNSEWQSMIKQMENFIPLKIEDIEPENRECDICLEQLGPLEEPIKLLPCGHVFGHVCLFQWLVKFMPEGRWWDWEASDDYWPHQSEEAFRIYDEEEFHEARIHTTVRNVSIAFNEHGRLKRTWRDYLNWISDNHEDLLQISGPRLGEERNATCPKCRTAFSILRYGVTGTMIEARLRFWDLLYEKVGISRSDKEEQSRNDLLRYIQMVQVPRTETKPEHMRPYTLRAQVSAMRFALRRGNRDLAPLQRYLRDAIFNLGCFGLHDGEYNPTSYETRRVPVWCYQVDRIERGLNPIITAVRADRRSSAKMAEKSEKFFLDLRQELSGSWRRTLYAQVGGDRAGLRWKMSWDLESEKLVEDPNLFAIVG